MGHRHMVGFRGNVLQVLPLYPSPRLMKTDMLAAVLLLLFLLLLLLVLFPLVIIIIIIIIITVTITSLVLFVERSGFSKSRHSSS